ncbi:helix-turn-helix transcriptional regulator [Yersinia massiliensis]|uniref:helix-turn-helix transcriptional regulator n=1 Tax=Yersinia massiliensis TaxID=419257 RepID=UPI001643B1D0|nr:LuxR C-terminal-related transcriptional regulator [Yersinia massiliensis]
MQITTTKKILTIAIIDNDNFFIVGLKIAISTYLKSKNREVKFIIGQDITPSADITFQAVRSGTFITPHSQRQAAFDEPHYFIIVDNKDSHLEHLYRDVKKSNIIYRHQSVDTLLQLIEGVIFYPQQLPEKKSSEPKAFFRQSLTTREYEVLCHLQQGKTHINTANCMGINVKSISYHKRAAMRKLNFKRTNELFHWMLRGGLSPHQRIKGN